MENEDNYNFLLEDLHFGSNLRASKEYREDIAKVLVKRCIKELN
ncbi:MAG: hypothetical protein ACK5LV_02905 [Lachnospirales bacterium]